jgi:hypothetical protein
MAVDQTHADRISNKQEDDGNLRCGVLGGSGGLRRYGYDQIWS